MNASHHRILIHRNKSSQFSLENIQDSQRLRVAVDAASQVVRIVEDLLSSSHILHCPIHIIPGLFATMGMHVVDIRFGGAVERQLAVVKVWTCMIALRELQTSWPVSGWIFRLFTKIVQDAYDRDGTGAVRLNTNSGKDFQDPSNIANSNVGSGGVVTSFITTSGNDNCDNVRRPVSQLSQHLNHEGNNSFRLPRFDSQNFTTSFNVSTDRTEIENPFFTCRNQFRDIDQEHGQMSIDDQRDGDLSEFAANLMDHDLGFMHDIGFVSYLPQFPEISKQY